MAIAKLRKFNPNRYKKKENTYDPNKQIEGLKKRIEGAGIDVEKALDKRNFIEKALNITPDQNAFFDILEVINRPQQALFGAIKAGQQGKDVGKGALEGLTRKGENAEVRFKNILQEAGMDDSGEKIGLDDVLGFAGDVLLDPVDLALIPVTAGASVAAKAASQAADAAKIVSKAQDVTDAAKLAAKGIKKGKEVSERAKAVVALKKAKKEAERLQKVADAAKLAVRTEKISPLQAAARGVKKGFQGTFKLADTGITKVLKMMDDTQIKKIADSGLEEATKQLKLVEKYKDFKKYVVGVFDAAKSIPKTLWDKATKTLGKAHLTQATLGVNNKRLLDKIDNIAKRKGVKAEELGEQIMFVFEGKRYKPVINMLDDVVLNPTQPLSEDLAIEVNNLIENYLKQYPKEKIVFGDIYKKVELKNGKEAYVVYNRNNYNDFVDAFKDDETLKKIEFNAPRFYSDEELLKMDELLKDADFKELFDDFETINKDMFEIIDNAYGKVLNLNVYPEGYVHHKATEGFLEPDDYKIRNIYADLNVEKTSSFVKGSTKSLTGRTYKMSANEANEIAQAQYKALYSSAENDVKVPDKKLFSEMIQDSVADFIGDINKFGKETEQITNFLIAGTFNNPDFIKPVSKGIDGVVKVPRGFQAIKSKKLLKRLDDIKPFLDPKLAKQFKKSIKRIPKDTTLAIDNNVLMWIGGVVNNEQTNILVKMLDSINNLFKKTKLLSPGFQMRNFVGNSTNMYLAGMKPDDIMKYYKKSDNIIRQGDVVLKKSISKEALTKSEQETLDLYQEFIKNNFHEVAEEVWDIPESIAKKESAKSNNVVIKKVKELQEFNNKLNSAADKRFRLAMLMWAKDNPDTYLKLGLNSPADLVRRTLFDPADLSFTEKKFVKRTMPFYTFAKKNLAYQMKNVVDNPKQYKDLEKTIRDIWEAQGIETKDIDEYKRSNFWIPVPSLTKDGKYVALKLNLPIGDLAEFTSDPLRRIISSMSPAIRVPFEVTANKQMFSNIPIQDFAGQKGYIIPEISRPLEYGLSASGLDVPVATIADIGRTLVKGTKGELDIQSPFDLVDQTVGRSLFSSGDIAKTQTNKAYDELNEIQDLLKLYKQNKIDIPKLADLNSQNKYLKRLRAKLKSLNNMG